MCSHDLGSKTTLENIRKSVVTQLGGIRDKSRTPSPFRSLTLGRSRGGPGGVTYEICFSTELFKCAVSSAPKNLKLCDTVAIFSTTL